jgi:hypothetical protein
MPSGTVFFFYKKDKTLVGSTLVHRARFVAQDRCSQIGAYNSDERNNTIGEIDRTWALL